MCALNYALQITSSAKYQRQANIVNSSNVGATMCGECGRYGSLVGESSDHYDRQPTRLTVKTETSSWPFDLI